MKPNFIRVSDTIQRKLDECFMLLNESGEFEDINEFEKWKLELYTELSIVKKIIELYYK